MSMELPEHLRNGPMAEAAKRALQDAANMASASNSVPRISLRGREFRVIEGGEEIVKFRDHMDIIIMGVEPEGGLMIKTWYEKGYTPGAKEPPTCASEDGIAPAPWVQQKQAPRCNGCPKNAFGSAKSPTGKPTKACRDSKRIWLKLADSNMVNGVPFEGATKPFADRTTYGMNITVASLKAFSDHGRLLGSLGQGPAVCVTRAVMLDFDYPQLDFKLHAWLGVEDTGSSLKLAAEKPWKMFSGAGLALAAPDSGSSSTASLPGSLPAMPDHLRQANPVTQAPGETTVAGGMVGGVVAGANLDDVIDKF